MYGSASTVEGQAKQEGPSEQQISNKSQFSNFLFCHPFKQKVTSQLKVTYLEGDGVQMNLSSPNFVVKPRELPRYEDANAADTRIRATQDHANRTATGFDFRIKLINFFA